MRVVPGHEIAILRSLLSGIHTGKFNRKALCKDDGIGCCRGSQIGNGHIRQHLLNRSTSRCRVVDVVYDVSHNVRTEHDR